jgi:hypothetical protein
MPQMKIVDSNVGLPEAEARYIISQGGVVFPKVTLGSGSSIAVAGSLQQTHLVDIWISPPEPMIPQSFIAGTLVMMFKQTGTDKITIDEVCLAIFGMHAEELEKRVTITPHPDGEAGGQRDESVVGKSGDADGSILRFPGQGMDGG